MSCVCESVCVWVELHSLTYKTIINGVIILNGSGLICIELVSIVILLSLRLGIPAETLNVFFKSSFGKIVYLNAPK